MDFFGSKQASGAARGWSVSYTYGIHQYRDPDEDSTVIFSNPEKNISRKIVGRKGDIKHFPGVDPDAKRRVKESLGEGSLLPVIRFRTDFGYTKNGIPIMMWQVQPDGRYWEDDDGFGGCSDPEIILYALFDDEGNFTGPFKLYRIGQTRFYK